MDLNEILLAHFRVRLLHHKQVSFERGSVTGEA